MFHASKDRRDFIDDIAVILYSIISSGILGLNSLGLISLKLSKSKTPSTVNYKMHGTF